VIIKRVKGATRVLRGKKGHLGLPVRDTRTEAGTPCMQSAWEPTPAELERLRAGAHVILTVLGRVHPTVRVEVGEKPSITAADGDAPRPPPAAEEGA
jgi:hypothetical protein